MAIAVVTRKVASLKPNSTVYKEYTYAASTLDKNSIGEYKLMTLEITCSDVLNRDIYYVPGMWAQAGVTMPSYGYKPSTAWKYSNGGASPSGEQPMTLVVASGYTPPASANYRCTIEFTSGTAYTIKHYYFETWDEHSFLLPSYQDNHSRFLKSSRYDLTELPALGLSSSGYGLASGSCVRQEYHFMIENNIVPPAKPASEFQGARYLYRAGWYEKNAGNATPYFSDPEFIFSLTSGVVTGLSVSEDTKLTFRISTTAFEPTMILLRIFRTDTTDNTIDFIANYEDSLAECVTTGGSSTIANKLKAPATGIAFVSGKWQVDITIDKTKLAFGQRYRAMAIVYNKSGGSNYELNSFISPEEIVVSELPNYAGEGLDFTAKLYDVDKVYTGNDLECVVEERMRSEITMDFASNKWADDILARLGLTVPNDIRRYLTEITVDVYEETTAGLITTKHVFAYPQLLKTSPTTYTTASGVTLDFSTADKAVFKYDFRNRYETHIANLYTYSNGVLLTSPTSNMFWGGRTINIKWGFKFYYDDYATPFSDTLYIRQMIRPKTYESGSYKIQTDGGLAQGEREPDFYCMDDTCFEAVVSPNDGYKLITTIEPDPGSILGIEEHEVWAPGIMTQQTNDKILSQEENFGETETNKANFCLSSSHLLVNLPYKISAIAKKSTTDEILTEDGQEILTESGDTILTE